MTTENRLVKTDTSRPGKRSAQEWCDRGNAILAGIQPMDHGKNQGRVMRRDDVCWFVENGRATIGWRK